MNLSPRLSIIRIREIIYRNLRLFMLWSRMDRTHKKPPHRKPASSGWSPERRARQAASIRRWRPWMTSTGPRTRAGKARSAQNSYKHGGRALPARTMSAALSCHSRFLRGLNLYIRGCRQNLPNELLENWRRALSYEGYLCTKALLGAFLMQKPCILGPPEVKS